MVNSGQIYSQSSSAMHGLIDGTREAFQRLRNSQWFHSFDHGVRKGLDAIKNNCSYRFNSKTTSSDYSHLYRTKTRLELMRISAAVMGIEFCYAAQTAFGSPTLLGLGVSHRHMTLIWCLGPLIGFFLTPLLGSMSDRCRSRLGRRRPFILLLSFGIVLGLILVPNGRDLGIAVGDVYPEQGTESVLKQEHQAADSMGDDGFLKEVENGTKKRNNIVTLNLPRRNLWLMNTENGENPTDAYNKRNRFNFGYTNSEAMSTLMPNISYFLPKDKIKASTEANFSESIQISSHPWGLMFTIIGAVLLDFNSDASQSPSRAYLLDVTIPEDHAQGLSTFTIMAGLGGGLGYAMGGINWDITFIGTMLGGHVRAVFTLILFIFFLCVIVTITSFKEIPLDILRSSASDHLKIDTQTSCHRIGCYQQLNDDDEEEEVIMIKELQNEKPVKMYGTVEEVAMSLVSQNAAAVVQMNGEVQSEVETSFYMDPKKETIVASQSETKREISASRLQSRSASIEIWPTPAASEPEVTLKQYLLSIVFMPKSLRILCLTNLFCWMSLVCYSLYFTDFVGEAVFGGDPRAPASSADHDRYEQGVRFGCWGMALYSLSCSAYSFIVEKLIKTFKARPVYVCGQLVYCVGMIVMGSVRNKICILIFSCTAGVMYSTLFTMPYLLIAHYHAHNTFEDLGKEKVGGNVRGLGTDVAILSSMVFLAQFILSSVMGTLVHMIGSTTTVVFAAAILSFCGAVSATQVMYLEL